MSEMTHEPAERRVAMLQLASVHPRDGFNPRSKRDSQKFRQLRASVARRGVLQPLLVTPDPERSEEYVIVAGESRYLAAVDAGVAVVPCLIDAVDGETDGLDDALVENLLREELSPMDEARAFRRLREGGLPARAIAQRVGRSASFVRERLALLDLPAALHGQIEDGTVPLSAVPALLTLGKIHPELPEVGVRRVLDGPVRSWEDPTTWEDLAADPVWIVTGSVPEQYEDLPEGVYVGGASYPVRGFALEPRATTALDKIAKLLGVPPDSLQVRFDPDAVEQAAALSAAFPSKDGYRTLIVGTDVASQLAADGLIARLREERAQAKRERDARHPAVSSADVAAPAADAVTYLETYDAARKASEYLAGASKAGEVAGRSLALLAAARWATSTRCRCRAARSTRSTSTAATGCRGAMRPPSCSTSC
ncbi:MAG TPA: ParB/RepB/Spo0J family partition protein [Conexibacter sp.]|jgi:ParB/RepB/Spo0J family partition protein